MGNTGSMNFPKSHKESSDNSICKISKEFSRPEIACEIDSKEPAWKCRYVITITGFLVFLLLSINRTVMGLVIVVMVNNTAINKKSISKSETCSNLMANSTENDVLKQDGEFIWSPETQGYVLGSYFVGHILIQIPAGRLAERFGCKWMIAGSLFVSGILTTLIPPVSQLCVSAVIIIQTLRGLFQGVIGPCIAVLASNWSPKNERGFLFSIMQSAHSMGPALGNIFSGYISESRGGWPCAFYVVGGSGLALALYVTFFTAESPKEHPHISKVELNFILDHQEQNLSRKRPKFPWRQFLTSVPVYAIIFSMFGRYWSISQFWIVHSTFLATILHFPVRQNGLLSATPFLISFLLSQIACWISLYIEKKQIFSVDFLRKFWIFTSSLGYSLCLLGVYIAGCDRNLSVIFAILSMGSTGLGTAGSVVVPQDMSPTFSGTIHSICCTVSFFASVTLPVVVGYLTDEMQTLEQWNKVFFISVGVVMSSAIVFVVFGSAKIQPWNFVGEEKDKSAEQSENNKDDKITRF